MSSLLGAEPCPGLAGRRGGGMASGTCGFRIMGDEWSKGARWSWALPAGQVLPWGEGLGHRRIPQGLLCPTVLLCPGQGPLHSAVLAGGLTQHSAVANEVFVGAFLI